MALSFHPGAGEILFCDYGQGGPFQPPEMMKGRPVVVISPRRRKSQIVSVVPLSSSAPSPAQPWHHKLTPGAYPPARGPVWAKCDMVAAVAIGRLDQVKIRPGVFRTFVMPAADLAGILAAVMAALGVR